MSTTLRCLLSLPILALASMPGQAAEFTAKDRQPTPAELSTLPGVVAARAEAALKEVKAPEGFDVTVFATPPAVNYPVFVAASPDGTLYVSSDGNGSIDRKPHMGRVLRVRDTNGDGQADEVKAFVPDVDSPRGLVWDHDRLYLLHPPDISVFIDRDHDGIADEKQTLVKGIGWTFKDRPADHASNGLTLGVDGWLYAAIGDFGFMEATGADGRKLQMRGGGVVRVRPDGSGLHVWADGTRNILEVALSPLLDGFARDNTNDGGGWDIRLHHFSGLTQHGYPRLFKNFPAEIVPPLADYGGGSGCGAAWVDEPGIPAEWNNLAFTADWGRDRIYVHPLTPKGATFAAGQKEFLRLPRPTDLDADGHGAIYAASWKGATFTWAGPDVGFIVRVTPHGRTPAVVPDFAAASPAELAEALLLPSHSSRLAAQRELVRRQRKGSAWPSAVGRRLQSIARDSAAPVASRVAALYAIALSGRPGSAAFLAAESRDALMAPWALRALGDLQAPLDAARMPITKGLESTDPRTRREALVAASRTLVANPGDEVQGHAPLLNAMIARLEDPDPIVAHTARRCLLQLKADTACLLGLVDSSASPSRRLALLQVLQSLPTPEVVTAVLGLLETEREPAQRQAILVALCRLHSVEGAWKGDSWGTRPDTRGPFYQPEPWSETPRIAAALETALGQAGSAETAFLGRELSRHRIQLKGGIDVIVRRAQDDPALVDLLAAQLAEAEDVPAAAWPLLVKSASAEGTSLAVRAQSALALMKTSDAAAWAGVLDALGRMGRDGGDDGAGARVRKAFLESGKLDQVHGLLESRAAQVGGTASMLSDAALLKLGSRKVGSPEARDSARAALDAGWRDPRRRVQILQAAVYAGESGRAAQFVSALGDSDAQVASAARETVKRLKIDPARFSAPASAKKIGEMKVEEVLAAVVTARGEIARGEQLFTQAGCNACHTVRPDEPLKGPFLGNIATLYRRRELAEAILLPGKTVAQGFTANHFELKDGTELDGFVVREAADEVTIRTLAAREERIRVNQIAHREKQERSLMPEGLAAGYSVEELASLLEYLESLSKGK